MTETRTQSLREDQLPVLSAIGCCKHSNSQENGASEENNPEVACVCQAACETADEKEEKNIEGADPGDFGGRAMKFLGIVGLEDAKGVCPAPGMLAQDKTIMWEELTMC